jgi:DNA-binding MarR family transcriptional regulator/predicted transcriptional regulator
VAEIPLSTLLAQALVAHTIEFDDLAEQRILHGTTVGGHAGIRAGGVWFTSQVMWTNFIRHIDRKGRPVREIQALACLSENAIKSRLHHLEWWSYLTFAPDPKDARAKPRYLDQLVKLTPNGEKAAKAWAPISAEVDKRWNKRFGKAKLDPLVRALRRIASTEAMELPDFMPVVDYGDGMRSTLAIPEETPARTPLAKLDLSGLLSRALLALALEYESGLEISLTAATNVLRVIDGGGTSLKELPVRAGVAKEGQAALVNFLKKKGYISLGNDKAKTVKLTAKGKKARDDYPKRVAAVGKRWEKSVGRQTVAVLRRGLDAILDHPKFVEGLKPHGGWRVDKRYAAQTDAVLANPRAGLPQHPMITHRGGFPDGS